MQTANSALNGARVERWWVAERWDPPVFLNVKPSVHSHGDWSREVPATRFYLDSFRVRCVYVSFHFAALRRAAVAARHTGGEKGGKIYFFQIFPRCLFDRWANLSRDERFDLTIFFFLFLLLLFERIFRWNFDIFGKNFGIFLIVRSDFVDSKLVRGECFAETEIDRNISILL